MCGGPRPRPSLGAVWANFVDSDLPIPRRVSSTLRGYWIRVRRRQGCCGRYGEPGC